MSGGLNDFTHLKGKKVIQKIESLRNFNQILTAYNKLNIKFDLMIDGGAGFGETSNEMLMHLSESGVIHAFEPNRYNHKFFQSNCKIKLWDKALFSKNSDVQFLISDSVKSNDHWASLGYEGYSSLGKIPTIKEKLHYLFKKLLINGSDNKAILQSVSAVRLDELIDDDVIINFAKLDLQGGEYDALIGFGDLLSNVQILWVEFAGDWRVIDLLSGLGYQIYDSSYMTIGIEFTELLKLGLVPFEEKIFSNNYNGYYSDLKLAQNDYKPWFNSCQKLGFIQTDLLAVNSSFVDSFERIKCDL